MSQQNNKSLSLKREKNISQLKKTVEALPILIILMIVGAVSIVVYALQAPTINQILSITSVGIMIAGAFLMMGGLTGFVFAIPRSNPNQNTVVSQNGDTPNVNRSVVSYEANTNLEQISDWLTKILVGVGLTQLSSIREGLQDLAEFFAVGLGDFESSITFALALLIYFSVCGFLLGYLWTRLRLAGAFKEADIQGINEIVNQVTGQIEVIQAMQEVAEIDINNPKEFELVQPQLDRLLAQDDVLNAVKVGRNYLKQKKYNFSLDVFKYLYTRVDRTNNHFRKILSNMGYSLIGLELYNDALEYLEQIPNIEDGKYFQAWHAMAIAYAYFQLKDMDNYQEWLKKSREMPKYDQNRRFFASLYPEIADELIGNNQE